MPASPLRFSLDRVARSRLTCHRNRLRAAVDSRFAGDEAAPGLLPDPGVVEAVRRGQEGEVLRRQRRFWIDRRRIEIVSRSFGRGLRVQYQALDDRAGGQG